jgi:hypothetical protein
MIKKKASKLKMQIATLLDKIPEREGDEDTGNTEGPALLSPWDASSRVGTAILFRYC